MKTFKMIFPKSILLFKNYQKQFSPPEKISYHKFNKEIFYINLVSGIIFTLIGIYFIGTTQINNTTDFNSALFSSNNQLHHVLPHSFGELFVFLAGNLLLLSGVICIFLALRLVVRYLASRLND